MFVIWLQCKDCEGFYYKEAKKGIKLTVETVTQFPAVDLAELRAKQLKAEHNCVVAYRVCELV